MLQIGQKIPSFTVKDDAGNHFSDADLLGKRVVLYFYPKDDTPGCTTEACGFRDNLSDFAQLNVPIYGVSKDSVTKHQKFKTKHNLTFTLLSDEESDMCEKFGVWQEKSMYGKKYMGIARTTFIISPEGVVEHVFENVKVSGHVAEVLQAIKSL